MLEAKRYCFYHLISRQCRKGHSFLSLLNITSMAGRAENHQWVPNEPTLDLTVDFN